MISMDFNSYSLAIFLIVPALFSFFGFEHETTHTIRVLGVFDCYYRT